MDATSPCRPATCSTRTTSPAAQLHQLRGLPERQAAGGDPQEDGARPRRDADQGGGGVASRTSTWASDGRRRLLRARQAPGARTRSIAPWPQTAASSPSGRDWKGGANEAASGSSPRPSPSWSACSASPPCPRPASRPGSSSGNLTEQYQSKGKAIANSIADASVEILLFRDAATIQADDRPVPGRRQDPGRRLRLRRWTSAAEIISHTFVPAIPEEVRSLDSDRHETTIQRVRIKERGDFIDVSSPILASEVGHVHVGMDRALIRHTIMAAIVQQMGLMGFSFLLGIAAAYFFVGRLAQPLNRLTDLCEKGRRPAEGPTSARNVTGAELLATDTSDGHRRSGTTDASVPAHGPRAVQPRATPQRHSGGNADAQRNAGAARGRTQRGR